MFVIRNGGEMVNKTFRLPRDLAERLHQLAKGQNISMNNLVVQCCEYALSEMQPPEKGTK